MMCSFVFSNNIGPVSNMVLMREILSLLVLILLTISSTTLRAEKVEFTFAYDTQEGFPSFMGNGVEVLEENPGTYIELLRLVEEKVPIKLTLVRYPWVRCKALLKLNQVDGINSSYRESRKQLGQFPSKLDGQVDTARRITSDTYRIYAKTSSGIRFDPDSGLVKNIGIGLVAPMGYSIVDDLRQRGVAIEENPSGVSSIMKMLAYDRVTGVIAHENQARYVLGQDSRLFKDIEAKSPPVKEKAYYVLISKGFYQRHPELAEQIWDAIAELRESHFADIAKKYLQQASNH